MMSMSIAMPTTRPPATPSRAQGSPIGRMGPGDAHAQHHSSKRSKQPMPRPLHTDPDRLSPINQGSFVSTSGSFFQVTEAID